METKGITCKIPLELHQQASREMQEREMTVSQYIEMVIREHRNGGITMANSKTLAFQVSEEFSAGSRSTWPATSRSIIGSSPRRSSCWA